MSDVSQPDINPASPVDSPGRRAAPWWLLPSLAAMVLMIFAGALVGSCFINNDTLRTTMFTSACSLAAVVTGYFFGSSAGSQRKDEVIGRIAEAPAADGQR